MNEGRLNENRKEETKTSTLAWTACAFAVALAGLAGSLWLSIGMGLKACPLCYYQRTFMMAVVGILLTGLLTPARASALPSLLALPAAVGGLGVAVFHVGLEAAGKLECPGGLLGAGTAPMQSLAAFLLLMIPLALAVMQEWKSTRSAAPTAIIGVVTGVLLAFGGIKSAPPLPAPPAEPYDEPAVVCRPPYQP